MANDSAPRSAESYGTHETHDWPAAHSMDTIWFAVDADGCVGVFDTGEDGALPERAASGGGAAEPSFDTWFFDATRAAYAIAADPDGWLHTRSAPVALENNFDGTHRMLAVLKDPRQDEASSYRHAPHAELPFGPWQIVHADVPRILASERRLSFADVEQLWRDRSDLDALIGEDEIWSIADDVDGGANHTYQYDHADDAGPGGYQRSTLAEPPRAPLKLSDLTAADQAEIGRVVLPIRFAEAERVHLADFMQADDCQMWGENLSLRGEPTGPAPAAPVEHAAPALSPTRRITIIVLACALVVYAFLQWYSQR